MKKLVNIAFIYAIAAMAGGVFYREFTKFSDFSGRTSLSFVHTHLFLLGMVMFLLAALFTSRVTLTEGKKWRAFLVVYNIGVPLTAVMLAVRGILQVRMVPMTPALDAAVSGVSGIAHILTGVGLVLFFLCLKKAAVQAEVKAA
ncbi:MAG: DUF2871 domain-containing protein [Clostridia bacterium]|nr:DUF2871 domain-containing protein [Clostridia bacterium]